MQVKTLYSSNPFLSSGEDFPPDSVMEQLQQISIESILESISDGIFIVDRDLRITFFNRPMELIIGIPRQKVIGQRCSKIFRSSLCEKNCIMQKTFATKTPILDRQAFILDKKGRNVPVKISTSLLRNRYNEMIGGMEIIQEHCPLFHRWENTADQVHFDELITKNPTMGRIIKVLPKIAANSDSVLIEGERGTGKEMLARTIHAFCYRNRKPFVRLNCSSLPDTHYGLELFRTRSSFFSGLHDTLSGYSSLTGGGTLFLQEVCDTSKNIQGMLLNVLRRKRTDSEKSARALYPDIMVIASSRKNLSSQMISGDFLRDLYFLLNSDTLSMPPLRKRKEDIPLMLNHIISCLNREQSKGVSGVSPEAMDLLLSYNFPGNISELKSIIHHSYSVCGEGEISSVHLPERVRKMAPIQPETFGMETAVHTVETQAIITALKRNQYNRTAAARDLGIHKSTFFRKIKQLGIVLPQIDGRFRPIL